MTLLQIGNMPVDLLLTQRSLPFGDCGNEFIQLIGLDHRHGVGANVVGCATRIDHAVGHLSLERAVSGESHDADKIRLVDSEVVCECADVLVGMSSSRRRKRRTAKRRCGQSASSSRPAAAGRCRSESGTRRATLSSTDLRPASRRACPSASDCSTRAEISEARPEARTRLPAS